MDEAQRDRELVEFPRDERRPEVQAHRHGHSEDRELSPRHRRLGLVRRRVFGGRPQFDAQLIAELGVRRRPAVRRMPQVLYP